jgi:F-type H+-transporting ATPase subunit gamma
MSSIRQYRNKIKTAKNIAKITKAMEMVAASRMRLAQQQAEMSRGYSDGIINLASILHNQIDPDVHQLLRTNTSSEKNLYVLIAPEKGLCGGLLTNIARFLLSIEAYSSDYIAVGNKSKGIAGKLHANILADFSMGLSRPKYEIVPPIARIIKDSFLSGKYAKVVAVYPQYVTTMTQQPVFKILLPLNLISENVVAIPNSFVIEPSVGEITESLLSVYLETTLYHFLLEAYASEQSARMVAMKNATDNADNLIGDLTIEYNQARQTNITNEIIDIGYAR